MAVISWPPVLVPRRCDVELRNFTKQGAPTATGRQQRVFADAGFLTATMEIPINSPEKVRAYRAMKASLRAGDQVDARIFDRSHPRGARHQDTDGDVTAAGAAALRATRMVFRVTGSDVAAGMYFSAGASLYIVTEVLGIGPSPAFPLPTDDGEVWDDARPWTDAAPAPRDVEVRFMPPLRAALAAGAGIRFANLTMRAELQDVNDGDLSLDLGRFGTATLTFRESI